MGTKLSDLVTDTELFLKQFGGCAGIDTAKKYQLAKELWEYFCMDAHPFHEPLLTFNSGATDPPPWQFELDNTAYWTSTRWSPGNPVRVAAVHEFLDEDVRLRAYAWDSYDAGFSRIDRTTPSSRPTGWVQYDRRLIAFTPRLTANKVLAVRCWVIPIEIDLASGTVGDTLLPLRPEWLDEYRQCLASRFLKHLKRGDILTVQQDLQSVERAFFRNIRSEYGTLDNNLFDAPRRPGVWA